MCFGQKVKTQQQQNKNTKNPSRSWELNPGPLSHKADELQLHHRVK